MNVEALAMVPAVMRTLARRLAETLQDRLVGLYLGGSTATGDFALATSDFDFLAVIAGDFTPHDLQRLEMLHQELLRMSDDARRLEGDYAPHHLLVAEGTSAPVPGVFHGLFVRDVDEIMLSADNIADMRLHGIAVVGPPPSAVLPRVTPEQVRAAVLAMLRDGPHDCASETDAASEILNLVRAVCALETGQPATKGQGAEWALARLGREWHPIIRKAQAVRHGQQVTLDDWTLRKAIPELNRTLRPFYEHPANS
ncbi:MAG TPA: aminoglycoside adenylyltransferase domain-containing protein [Chloroflexota bacterium]|nr:aminoglycoside adenylyltransferase domain-containing protein [Chloroflexota bacterium]